MSEKCRYTPRREIVAATLLTVLSIALLAQPRLLLSQSDEDALARGAMDVAEFYIQRGNLAGAILRLEDIAENYKNFYDMDTVLRRIDELYEIAGAQNPDAAAAVTDWYLKVAEGYPSGRIRFPVLIRKIEPIYPETAKAAGVSGDVLLILSVDEKGETVRVSAIDGHPELVKAAITAVSQWRYEPAQSSGGVPVPTTFGALIRFLPDGTIDSDQGWTIYIEH